ncbi:MAG: FlgD immunoglobulin-like domain containing protein [Candidatus Eisenbacteria bacterium]
MLQRTPRLIAHWFTAIATIALLSSISTRVASSAIVAAEEPQLSAGAEAAAQFDALRALQLHPEDAGARHQVETLVGGPNWDAIKFIDVAALTGFFNIPPDPMGAAGPSQNIDVINTGIESWTKTGTLQWRASLKTFMTSLVGGTPGNLGTDGFDPKVVYDHHAGRFVVCLLERKTTTPTASRIIVAVSKTSTPASATTADWYYYAINSQITITSATFADYPGLEVDEDAIYITTNQFRFSTGAFAGSRLWIVRKAPLYTGGAPVHNVYNPYTWAGSVATTTMPALVFGPAGAGPGIGTYLTAYSGLNDGTFEYLEVTRVDDPLAGGGGPFFTGEFINLGTIDDVANALPKGPQLGSAIGIDGGDRRVYDSVWRNNNLWLTATTLPLSGPNAAQTTTHWWRIGTAAVTSSASPAGLLTIADDGEAGAEDVATGAMTAWSGIAVNSLDEMKLTYGVFAPSIYPSFGIAGRQPGDAAGTLQPSVIVRPGLAPYVRTFTAGSTGRNRWGDYAGMSVDPVDDRTFWAFHEWADVQGNPTTVGGTTEDGQWATTWASCTFECTEIQCPPQATVTRGTVGTLVFCIKNCSSLEATYQYQIINNNGWCQPTNGSITVQPGTTECINDECLVPADAECGLVKPIIFVVSANGVSRTCETSIMVDCGTPTRLAFADAEVQDGGVMLHWTMADGLQYQGFHVYREEGNTGRVRLTDQLITGATDYTYFDRYAANQPVNYWLAEIELDGSTVWHGPIAVTYGTTMPTAIAFAPARPNPFGATTSFSYALPRASDVRLNVFDAAGHLVRSLVDGAVSAGNHTVTWNGTDLAGRRAPVGIYMIVLNAGGEVHRQKVLLGR